MRVPAPPSHRQCRRVGVARGHGRIHETLVVRYGDEHGHHVGGDVWTSTDFLACQDGVVAQGLDWDWSDPDLGIRYRRLFAGYETADENPAQASQRPSDAVQADEHVRETSGAFALVPKVYATEWRVLVSDEDLAHALSVVVDGQVVLERPRGRQAGLQVRALLAR